MTEELTREVWQSMSALVLNADTKRAVSEALGLSFARIRALRRIAPGPIAMRDLVTALATDPPYVTLVVDDLEARGLVVRSTHPDDRRAKLVSPTPAGRQLARRAEAILARPPAVLADLSERDLADLHRILSHLAASAALQTDGGK